MEIFCGINDEKIYKTCNEESEEKRQYLLKIYSLMECKQEILETER